jgi:predicted SAM-dependent methyltransferase
MNNLRAQIKYFRQIAKRFRLKLQIKRKLLLGQPVRIVIGASGIYDPGWIPTDIDILNLLDNNDWKYCFRKNSIDMAMAEHVWEHLTEREGIIAAEQCYIYIKHGGHLRIAVPDGYHPSKEYIDYVKPGGSGFGSDDHKVLYNYKSLGNILETAGFTVDALEYFDEQGEFHCQAWSLQEGKIRRSKMFDERNQGGSINYTSIILDGRKE